MRDARIAAATFMLGLALLLLAESSVLRAVALVLLFGGLCLGVLVIATPEFVRGDAEDGSEGMDG